MTALEAQLAQELQTCKGQLKASEKRCQHLEEQVRQLELQNQLLLQKVDLLVRRIFGASSEKLNPAQLELLLGMGSSIKSKEEPTTPIPPSSPVAATETKAKKERRPRIPDNLPVVEQIIDPEPVKVCPDNWRLIGEEVTEQLDFEPGRILKRRIIRRKYVERANPDAAPVIAKLPKSLQERCLAAPGLIAHIIVSKYCDHLPLYRQEQIFKSRYQVELSRQSLANWMELAADWLAPIYREIKTGVLAGGYTQMDETPVEYLAPGNGATKLGYFWACNSPMSNEVFFHWETSRAAECLGRIIPADFTGTIQRDGYSAYDTFASAHPKPIVMAGCWAHVRRKFHEAADSSPTLAGLVLRQIQNLYAIESGLRQQRAGPKLKAARRAAESRPIIQRLKAMLMKFKSRRSLLPQSPLFQAIDYAFGLWPTLEVYVTDGRVEIDNNKIENAIRPTALGKKNWLFIGEAEAGQRSAILYTIIENCRRQSIDPHCYLKEVLSRLPDMLIQQVKDITPKAWAKNYKELAA